MKGLVLGLAVLSGVASAHTWESYQGDKIHFQGDSAFISAVNNKSLCLDGDTYKASASVCVKKVETGSGDDFRCVKYGKVQMSQPVSSTRLKCVQYRDSDNADVCVEYGRVAYVQQPTREVKVFSNDGESAPKLESVESITIPACSK